jgi:leader peptidase (prepilin peptidase)/N-methyltransferase
MFVAVSAVVGVAVGLFLNVVIDRVPLKESPLPPMRRCGECEAEQTGWAALVPVGTCEKCGTRRPRRYLVVPAANGVLFALAAHRFGANWVSPPFMLLFGMLLTVSVVDIQLLRIPDRIVVPTLLVSVPIIVAVSVHYDASSQIGHALVGSAAYFTLLLIPHLISPRGMGFGDVKLAAVMGLYLGWITLDWVGVARLIFDALLLGAVLGVVLGLGVGAARKKMGAFPFGPALALACVIVVYFSRSLT